MSARFLFNVSAAIEVLLGIALLIVPAYVVGLLLGDGLNQAGTSVARVLGIGLLSLGISAWETAHQETHQAPRAGICTYNLGVAALLSVLGTLGESDGILLWPAVGLHGVIGATMLSVMLAPSRKGSDRRSEE